MTIHIAFKEDDSGGLEVISGPSVDYAKVHADFIAAVNAGGDGTVELARLQRVNRVRLKSNEQPEQKLTKKKRQ